MKSIKCFFGWHRFKWDYVRGTSSNFKAPPPDHAKCERCGILFGNTYE